MEARLEASSQSFLEEAFPKGSFTLLLIPTGPEREALLTSLLLHGLQGDVPVLAVLSNTSPKGLLAKLASAGGPVETLLGEGRLRLLDWYSHKEGEVKETVEDGGIVRCPGSLEALEGALQDLLATKDGGGHALLEFLTDATWFGKEKAVDLAASVRKRVLKGYADAVLILDAELVAPDTIARLEEMADGAVRVHRQRTEAGPTWKVTVHRDGKEVSDHFLSLKPPFVDFTLTAEPEKVLEVPVTVSEEVPGPKPDPCPECGAALDEGDCTACDYAAEDSRLGQIREVLQRCEERLGEKPDDLDARFTKAVALARLRQYDEAVETLNEVAKRDTRYPALWMLKAKIYERVGDDLKAKLCRQRALEIEEAEMISALDADVDEERFQCPLCHRWLPLEANACPCGAEFSEEDGT